MPINHIKEFIMPTEFPQVDLPSEIVAWPDVTEDILNIYKQSCRLQAAIFCVCREGDMKASINLIDYEIKQNDIITLLPGTIIQFRERTQKVKLSFIGFSAACLERHNLVKNFSNNYSKISEYPIVPLNEEIASYFNDYFALISRVTYNEKLDMGLESTDAVVHSVLTAVNAIYKTYSGIAHPITRKEEICKELIHLVTQYYAHERKAQFYADKLGISLQHLSTTIKQVTGKNVLDVISYVVIMDAKAKLKSTDMTIQEIAYSLNFPNASFFGKYFKRYVGMTPLDFRTS